MGMRELTDPVTPDRLAVALLTATRDLVGPLGDNRDRVERQLMSATTTVCRALNSPDADAAWMTAAAAATVAAANVGEPFRGDDVWDRLDREHPRLAPPDPRAMGAAFAQVQRRGLIAPAEETRRSARRTNHGRPVRIWQPTQGNTA